MKSKSTLLIALAVVFMFHGCAEEQQEKGFGSASVNATVSALSVDEVARIQVTVSGPNITPDIVSELTQDAGTGEWSGLIGDIPAGVDRTFLAEAFDAANAVIYSGTVTGVTVVDGEQVVVNLFLQQSTPPDPFANTVPIFQSLVVSSAEVAPGRSANLTVAVSDPDPGDVLTLSWTATGGSFDVSNAPSVAWTAPSTEGFYVLTVAASDSSGATSSLTVTIDVRIHYGRGSASIQVDINTWPVVQNLVPTPTLIDVGGSTLLDLAASDPDSDALTYAWSADCTGTFSDASVEDPSFTLDADNGGAVCTLTVAIDDGRGGSNTASAAIATGPPISRCTLPPAEPQGLLASDGESYDSFGVSVSVSGDTAVIGAKSESFEAGAAYVFARSAGIWTEQQKLVASPRRAPDRFGASVSVSGDTAVIGAVYDDVGASSGAAHVFTRSAGVWTEQQMLVASDRLPGDGAFGVSVSVSGDTAVVGVKKERQSGAAYVFTRSAGIWTEQQKLVASDPQYDDAFGVSVSVSGDTAVIGANGEIHNNHRAGAAYVFTRSAGIWTEQQKLADPAPSGADAFGVSVSVSGDTAVIGANGAYNQSGAAYVFARSAGIWTEQQKLVDPDRQSYDWFGVSVSVSGDTAVIGANGDYNQSGAAYVFTRSAGIWTEQQKLVDPAPVGADWFGVSVSVSGDTAAIGAQLDDVLGVGVDSGATYMYIIGCEPPP